MEHTRPRPHGVPDRVQGLIDNLIARNRDRSGPESVRRLAWVAVVLLEKFDAHKKA